MDVTAILATLADDPGCELARRQGRPRLHPTHELPSDLGDFYDACGGLRFIRTGVTVVGPDRFVSASEMILGAATPDDLSARWYVIAENGTESSAERVVIDLSDSAHGRCYDAFWDVYAVAGSMRIVAESFAHLLEQLIRAGGQAFWSDPSFVSPGDAYDTA